MENSFNLPQPFRVPSRHRRKLRKRYALVLLILVILATGVAAQSIISLTIVSTANVVNTNITTSSGELVVITDSSFDASTICDATIIGTGTGLDWGDVQLGQTYDQFFCLGNIGTTDIPISITTDFNTDYGILTNDAPTSLSPGQFVLVDITWDVAITAPIGPVSFNINIDAINPVTPPLPCTVNCGPPVNPLGLFTNIVVIAMENQNYGDVIGSPAAPFINSLLPFSATIPNYHSFGATTPINGCSAGCYIALTSGSDLGVSNDYAPGSLTETSLMDQMVSAGLTWSAFCDNGCPRGADHFPFLGYASTQNSPNIHGDTGPNEPGFIAELNSATPANLIWLTPDDSENMHDNSVQSGDAYLQNLLIGSGSIASPMIGSVLASSVIQSGHALLMLWWDESSDTSGISANLFFGPMINPGFVSTANNYDEYATLHTIEANFGLAPLLNAASAPIMTDLFTQPAPPPTPTALTITASCSSTTLTINQQIDCSATATGGTAPYGFGWDLNNVTVLGVGPTISHIFTATGAYTINVAVSDSAIPIGLAQTSISITVT